MFPFALKIKGLLLFYTRNSWIRSPSFKDILCGGLSLSDVVGVRIVASGQENELALSELDRDVTNTLLCMYLGNSVLGA